MEGEGIKVTKYLLSSRLNIPLSTCQRSWGRRNELSEVGVIKRRKGQGRKRSAAFSTPEAKRRSIEVMEDLKMGEHLPEAAKKLQCSVRTLQRNTQGQVTWRNPPLQDALGNTPVVHAKRLAFAKTQLTPEMKLRSSMANATHLDHKQVHAFGLNRSHQKQCREKGSKKPLRPKLKQNFNPKVHCFFAANSVGTEVHIHAKEVHFIRKEGTHVAHEKVTGESLAEAVTKTMVPFMKRTRSRLAVLDCVNLNHCKPVIAAFKAGGIKVYPSAGFPHNKENGFPPYSHDLSILDGCLFRPFQSDIAERFYQLQPEENRSSLCALIDLIPEVWRGEKYCRMSRKALKKQSGVMVKIINTDGAHTRS